MIETRLRPRGVLTEYIDSIWISEKTNRDTHINLLPGTGSELYFLMDGSFRSENQLQGRVLFISLRNRSISLTLSKHTVFIAVRFKFSNVHHFCNRPISNLFDRLVPGHEIWGDAILQAEKQGAGYCSIGERIDLVECFLTKQLALNLKTIYIKGCEIRSIYEVPNERKIKEIAQDNGLSIRQFEKVFLKQMGVTAKKFQSLARFQKVVKSCLLNRNPDYLPIALKFGYYDQAHFIKDFRSKTQMTPGNFLCDEYFSTHFYNTSTLVDNTFAAEKE